MNIFEELEKLGVHSVDVEYSGSSDDGSIDDPHAVTATNEVVHLSSALDEQIKDRCYDHLAWAHPGWEINAGSTGRFILSVTDRTIRLEHTDYIITEDYSEEDIGAAEFFNLEEEEA